MNNTVKTEELKKSLEKFNLDLDKKDIASGTTIEVFKAIKEDIEELDIAMFNQVGGILIDMSDREYKNKLNEVDALYDVSNNMSYEEIASLIDYTPYSFDTLGIKEIYFESNERYNGKLSMYLIDRQAYEYKFYNINPYDEVVSAFEEYEKCLEKIFDRYKDITDLDVSDAIDKFEELLDKELI